MYDLKFISFVVMIFIPSVSQSTFFQKKMNVMSAT
jgi:hypothetical protein